MSCDFAVWFPDRPMSKKEAGKLYERLCEGDFGLVQPHAEIEQFYRELTGLHPEIDDVPEDKLNDADLCPWSCAFDRSPGHLIIPCVWSRADYVEDLILRLTKKYGLAVYDPQTERLILPGG